MPGATRRSMTLHVKKSDFMASCDCDDFWRRKDKEQLKDAFASRKAKAMAIKVLGHEIRYGVVTTTVETSDHKGIRKHEVYLSRGDGDMFVCKHIIRALKTKAIMPDLKFKTIVPNEDTAKVLARMYRGKLLKRGRQPDVVVAAVNDCYVVGWRRE